MREKIFFTKKIKKCGSKNIFKKKIQKIGKNFQKIIFVNR